MKYFAILFVLACSCSQPIGSDACSELADMLADSVLMLRTVSHDPDPSAVDRAEDIAIAYTECTLRD